MRDPAKTAGTGACVHCQKARDSSTPTWPTSFGERTNEAIRHKPFDNKILSTDSRLASF